MSKLHKEKLSALYSRKLGKKKSGIVCAKSMTKLVNDEGGRVFGFMQVQAKQTGKE